MALLAKNFNEGTTYNGYTITLDVDIDLNNIEWTPIGNNVSTFNGTFDGDNHTISNLTIQNATTDWQALFGYVSSNGKIQNLTLSGVNIVTNQEYVAAVAGVNNGTIQDCTVTNAVIIGKNNVGALAGANAIYGQITNNTVSAQVAGNGSFVGALVGHNNGEVTGNTYTSNLSADVGYRESGTVSDNTVNGTLTATTTTSSC